MPLWTEGGIMIDCPRVGKWIGGCNFEARHDKIPVKTEDSFWIIGTDRLNALAKRIYVRDVCTRCGKTIERSKP